MAEKANFTRLGRLDRRTLFAGRQRHGQRRAAQDRPLGRRQGSDGHAVDLALEAGGGKLGFKGKLSELGPNAKPHRPSPPLSASADRLRRHADQAGRPAGAGLPPLLASKFTFDGAVELSQTEVAARDFKLALGERQRLGSLDADAEARARGRRQARRCPRSTSTAGWPASAKPAAAGRRRGKPAPPAAPADRRRRQPARRDHRQGFVRGGEVVYNKQPVRNVAIELDAKGGVVAVPKLTATLPGDMVLQAQVDPVGRSRAADGQPASSAWSGPSCARRWPGSRSTSRRCRPTSSRGSA